MRDISSRIYKTKNEDDIFDDDDGKQRMYLRLLTTWQLTDEKRLTSSVSMGSAALSLIGTKFYIPTHRRAPQIARRIEEVGNGNL